MVMPCTGVVVSSGGVSGEVTGVSGDPGGVSGDPGGVSGSYGIGLLLCDKTGTGFSSVPPRSMYVSVLSTERLITGPSEKDFLLSTTKSPITSPFSKFITSTNPLPSTK